MKFGLIGEKLSHSHSPKIHALLGFPDYELCEIPRDGLDEFMRAKNFEGINVTIPYKTDVIPYLDFIDESAKEICAVNTIVNRGGKLYGYNTDCMGFLFLSKFASIDFSGKKVLLLGDGGTAKTVTHAAAAAGAKEISFASRRGEIKFDNLASVYDADILVNTTPVGMYPKNGETLVALDNFQKLSGVLDVIYNPLSSRLVLDAKERGIKASGGLLMLCAQAAFACQHFHGVSFSEKQIISVYRQILSEVSNIVLIGMPGCGKSRVGKKIAAETGREFFDTDELVEAKSKMTIPEIFENSGEGKFRETEKEVCAEVSKKCGVIIATGGGAPTFEENRKALAQNSFIVYIDRPTEQLATNDRPLSRDISALKRMKQVREPLYSSLCDVRVITADSVEKTASRVLSAFAKYR